MTTEQWLLMLRRRIAQVDVAASDYTDEELLFEAADARDYLELKNVPTFADLAVDMDPVSASYGITPDPTLSQAQILVVRAALQVLSRTYTDRLMRGEIGTSWRSGLEEETSIQAARAYRQMLDLLAAELEELILIAKADTAGDRVQ
jgi:hypothetical protein